VRGGPLQGVRVVELTKVWAGPYTGKLLAYLGAEVIKVESLESLDVTRSFGVSDRHKSPAFQSVNPQKLSVQLNTKTAQGVALVLQLLRGADVLVENLRPGAMQRQGLGYEAVRKVRPDLVYISMGMYGSAGPLREQTGYAPSFAALGGLSALVGYEGRPPAGMNVRYGDSTYGTAAAYAALVALLHRRRTGQGQFIDVAAVECMSSMIGDSLLAHAINGEMPASAGNRHPEQAPHGVYPCRGGEWLSLAVPSEPAWRALAAAMEMPRLAQDPAYSSLAQRKLNEAALDRLVAQWTARHDAAGLAASLQRRGIAAAKSLSSVDLVADAHLHARGLYPEVSDEQGQAKATVGPSWKMSRPAVIGDAAPRLGQHNAQVLGALLGLSAQEQQRLAAAGVAR
jgi:crotonobetainyl-CoA:carnitine CoA-transferase CaiB-like acyl-CoA transferase